MQDLHGGGRPVPMGWTRVRLLERWDVMGRGAASAFLGIRSGHPGFGMLALDSSVYIRCSTGERGVDVVAVRHPDRSESVLRQLEWFASWRGTPSSDRALQDRIAVWLASRAPGAVGPTDQRPCGAGAEPAASSPFRSGA
ncbi:hypothetical protein [Streptomyces sp. NPDC048057]|uniref:hypothetical protein n=1 Tax=Streptomyces sp. NPDC048057 TaxID=3155628 RepID=UPI0033E68865